MFFLSRSLFFVGTSSCLVRTKKKKEANKRNPKRTVTSVMALVRSFVRSPTRSKAMRDGGASDVEEGYKCFWRRSQKAIDPGCYCLLQDLCGSRVASVFLASDQIRGAWGQSLRRGAADDGVGARRADCRRFSPPPLPYPPLLPSTPPPQHHHHPSQTASACIWAPPETLDGDVCFCYPGFFTCQRTIFFLPLGMEVGRGWGCVGRERKTRKKSRTPKFRY